MGHRRDHLHSGGNQGHVTLGRIKVGLRLRLGGEQVTVTFCGILFILFYFIYLHMKATHKTVYTMDITRSSADADNALDAFVGQSRSTNMVPFHMLHIVSYCAIVTCI